MNQHNHSKNKISLDQLEDDCQPNKQLLLVDGFRGIHVPNYFVSNFDLAQWSLNPEDDIIKCLKAGADQENYWACFDDLLRKAAYTDMHGRTWHLESIEGDLFAVCEN